MSLSWKLLRSLSGAKSEEANDGSPLSAASTDDTEDKNREGGVPVPNPSREALASRFAKVFSKSTEKERPPQTGELLSLPYELLERIFHFIPLKCDLYSLRGTCNQFNLMLEESIFSDLSIDCTKNDSHKTGHMLKHLGTGKCRASHLTTTLRISNLVPFTHPKRSGWQDPDIDERLRPLQQNYLPSALKSLHNLKTVFWSLKISDPYTDICDALTALPSLEALHLRFDRWMPTTVFPFEKFSGLKVLALERGDYASGLSTATIPSLRRFILNSPDLSEMVIEFELELATNAPATLDDLIYDPAITSSPLVRFRKLRLLEEYLSKPLKSLDCLQNLTSLDISNEANANPDFWESLRSKSIQLQTLKVDTLPDALIKYLLSYSGLRELHIRVPGDDYNYNSQTNSSASRIFSAVIPKHRLSLTRFRLYAWDGVLSTTLWRLNDTYLASLLECPSLRELGLIFYYEPDRSKGCLTVAQLLRSLSKLRRLEFVYLIPVWSPPAAAFGCGNAALQFSRTMAEAYLNEIREVEIDDPASYLFSVETLPSHFELRRGEKDRIWRFVDLNPKRPNGWIDGIFY